MKKLLIMMIAFTFLSAASKIKTQGNFPDLNKKEDLLSLETGRIFETDNTSIKKIKLTEVHDTYIVYEKDASLHDLSMDKINRIEFPETKWGALILKFPGNKPLFTRINTP